MLKLIFESTSKAQAHTGTSYWRENKAMPIVTALHNYKLFGFKMTRYVWKMFIITIALCVSVSNTCYISIFKCMRIKICQNGFDLLCRQPILFFPSSHFFHSVTCSPHTAASLLHGPEGFISHLVHWIVLSRNKTLWPGSTWWSGEDLTGWPWVFTTDAFIKSL